MLKYYLRREEGLTFDSIIEFGVHEPDLAASSFKGNLLTKSIGH